MTNAPGGQKFLTTMLERLYSALSSGPTLNCRPANSRQRLDLTELRLLQDMEPDAILSSVLGADGCCTVRANAAVPPPLPESPPAESAAPEEEAAPGNGRKRKAKAEAEDPETRALREAYEAQSKVLRKLRSIAEDTRVYEQDTGTNALYIGFPLLSLPPGEGRTSRLLAPMCFVPINLSVQTGRRPAAEFTGREKGVDRIVPNPALVAWVERQTGKTFETGEVDEEAGAWDVLNAAVRQVCTMLQMEAPALSAEGSLVAAPRAEALTQAAVLCTAVLGLYPLSNQAILSDVRDMAAGAVPAGPVESFLRADLSLAPVDAVREPSLQGVVSAAADRCVSMADPCQRRAVQLARNARGLVIHGPPGTGKSQTIANIIGDHLARGERVLMVCDKRTALDVVHQRLDHMGLGDLCAIVHDAHGDRSRLYLSVRNQLETLAETSEKDAAASSRLETIDRELEALHQEFQGYLALLATRPGPDALSFSELAGEWLQSHGTGVQQAVLPEERFTTTTLAGLQAHRATFEEALQRGQKLSYSTSPWRNVAGLTLSQLLQTSEAALRDGLEACHRAALRADQVTHSLPFGETTAVLEESRARLELASMLADASAQGVLHRIERWVRKSPQSWRKALADIEASSSYRDGAATVQDRELEMAAATATVLAINQDLQALQSYLRSLSIWYGFLQFGVRKRGREVLTRYGLGGTAQDAARLKAFLEMRRSQAMLSDLCARGLEEPEVPPTEALKAVREHEMVLRILLKVAEDDALSPIRTPLMERLQEAPLVETLQAAGPWAEAVAAFELALGSATCVRDSVRHEQRLLAREGKPVADLWPELLKSLPDLEGIVRIHDLQNSLPVELARAVRLRLLEGFEPEHGWQTLVYRVCDSELKARMAANPTLVSIDADRLQACQNRFIELSFAKQEAVRVHVRQVWLKRQRSRLLASTGGRLNNAGAELKRRLHVRGVRALRLRQVVAAGRQIGDGDPLFDLRPVWMASPGTVAQIFPREALFDVVIFDEASQCRLEEAIPVMTRARRVVIAGDPKQLPPTRFFESAVIDTGESDAETDQELFEQQQSEVEDVLSAALNLEIDQAYLDVHYRSANEALIGYSNESFYNARLQAIPGHPRHRQMVPPIRLVAAGGVYDRRTNKREAEEVVRIVRELLRRAEPPSIGIACFNLTQRDVLVEALDAAALEDPEFAARLADARTRQGRDSFQGLFVKNLENVQGDERDVMIISTTFGPDPTGRFYRRFGPLALAGGARRLNVLVTRARQEVIVVTSIPPSAYRNEAAPPPGRTPNGAWHLFAYLRYAEALSAAFEQDWERRKHAQVAQGSVKRYGTATPSKFVELLAANLAERHKHSSEVYWGDDGFCIDLALQHPTRAEDVTIGVLCDGTRYPKAPDAAEWDAFRTLVLKSQGWALHRVWTPHFVRNPERALQELQRAVERELDQERAVARQTSG